MIADLWQWVVGLLGLMVLFWLNHRISLWQGRMMGRREITHRTREQQRQDFRRGQFDAFRRAGIWLRQHGRRAEADAMPAQLLDPEEAQDALR